MSAPDKSLDDHDDDRDIYLSLFACDFVDFFLTFFCIECTL